MTRSMLSEGGKGLSRVEGSGYCRAFAVVLQPTCPALCGDDADFAGVFYRLVSAMHISTSL